MEEKNLSRRSFVKWSGILAGSTALASGLVACSPGTATTESRGADPVAVSEEGVWKTALCNTQFAGCGGSCVIKCLVNDGQIVRTKTDDFGDDDPANPQMRCCHRGRQFESILYAPDRLKYPMKRKNWSPGGGSNSNGHLRGIDEWERISWDEATTLIAEETKRIVDTYGNTAILDGASPPNCFNLLGGYVSNVGASSWGGLWWTNKLSVGGAGTSGPSTIVNDKLDLRNSKLIVCWSYNPAWSSQAQSTYSLRAAKEAGAKFIFVDPIYNDTAKVLGDQFIPCRPCTDAALLLSLAYVMITNDLQDQDFLDKYTVGFDADHMPEGYDPQENYKDYVLGTYDGVPKTPEWASEICGTPVELIESFAREIATTKPMAFLCQRAAARTTNGDQFAQNFYTVGWMTGNVGKSGACVGHGFGGNKDAHGSGPVLVKAGGKGGASDDNPVSPYSGQNFNPADMGDWTSVHASKMWDAVLDGEYLAGKKGVLPIDIHMISNLGFGNCLNQNGGAEHGIKAHRKVDFVVASDFHLTTSCLYADIVLPIAYKAEEAGISATSGRRREMLLAQEQVIEPLFEAKTDLWVDYEIGKKLGFSDEQLMPVPELQQNFNTVLKATVMKEDGSEMVPLFTVTQEDFDKYGVTGEPQEGVSTIQEFLDRGCHQVQVAKGDAFGFIALKEFVDDPVENSLSDFTETGLLQISCPQLAQYIDDCGFDAQPRAPIGKYVRQPEGYEDTFSDWENKVKGDYPFQLLTLHSWRSGHSWGHNYPYVIKAFPNDLLINKRDAEERGIKAGDTVLITTRWGKSIRNANPSEIIMPGVIQLVESSWPTVDEETGIDKAGASNYLCGPIAAGAIIQPWNSANAQVEKWTGEQLEPDYRWFQRIVEV